MRELISRFFDSKNERERKIKILAIAAVLAIIAIIIIVKLAGGSSESEDKTNANRTGVDAGVAYLESLAAGDVDAYQEEINQMDKDYRMQQLEQDPDAVWGAFNDAVIIGDSRAYGFYSYEFLPQTRVLAKAGGKITDIEEDPTYIPAIETLNPSYIFVCNGLNDVGIGLYPEGKDLADKYVEELAKVQEVAPNAQIIISSIPATNATGTAQNAAFGRIDEYNEALAAMCEEQEFTYVDVSQTLTDFGDPYQTDGIHFVPDFYLEWAMELVLAME